jgi:hypothetical protein
VKPCKHGHTEGLYANGRACIGCHKTPEYKARNKAYAANYRAKNPEKAKTSSAASYAKNADRVLERVYAWKAKNPLRVMLYAARVAVKRSRIALTQLEAEA